MVFRPIKNFAARITNAVGRRFAPKGTPQAASPLAQPSALAQPSRVAPAADLSNTPAVSLGRWVPTPKGSRHFSDETPITKGLGRFEPIQAARLRSDVTEAEMQLSNARTLRAIVPELRESLIPKEAAAVRSLQDAEAALKGIDLEMTAYARRTLNIGSRAAIENVFTPFLRAEATGPSTEKMLRGMHSEFVGAGYRGHMPGQVHRDADFKPGVMLMDLHRSGYNHPYSRTLDGSPFHLHPEVRAAHQTNDVWYIEHEGVPQGDLPFNVMGKDYFGLLAEVGHGMSRSGKIISHQHLRTDSHPLVLRQLAGDFNHLRAMLERIEGNGGKVERGSAQHLELATHLGRIFRRGMAPQFFPRINNSIFMSIVNSTMQRVGLPQMGHDMLHDAVAFMPQAQFQTKWLQSALRKGEYPFRDAPFD